MRNILVTGTNGQLGSELRELVMTQYPISCTPYPIFHFTDRDSLDITNKDAIESFIGDNKIKIIINCAAYTAVDKAEDDQINADKINHLAVKYLAQIAKVNHIKLIHISTDYVFDGKNYKPYTETDSPHPNGVYGLTKLDGEKALQEINPKNSIIIRTSWVYSSYGTNFVKTMLRLGKERESLGVIFDQVGTPTYARDLAKAIIHIIQHSKLNTAPSGNALGVQNSVEVYHYSNEGVVSWYDFAKTIFELSGIKCDVKPIETKDYPTPARRPHYSLLNKAKIKEHFGLSIPYWKDSLDECIKRIMDSGDRI